MHQARLRGASLGLFAEVLTVPCAPAYPLLCPCPPLLCPCLLPASRMHVDLGPLLDDVGLMGL